ncbi:hypothetical protein D922_02744, partial [Enterococcus faecalis 06-MB-DW-09]
PKVLVEQGATVTITTTAGATNTIDLRGENPEIALQNGDLSVSTIGAFSEITPTNTTNNAVVLSGIFPKITVHQGSLFTVRTTLSKRGIHLVGDNAQLEVNNSNLSVVSATQAALNIDGESPKLVLDSSNVNITSTTGQRINLIGVDPLVSLASTEMIMDASTGRGIYLQGATPQVLMENSQILMTDTDASQGMILDGEDALLSLSNQSEVNMTGSGIGTSENIQIGNNNARPEILIANGSKLSVRTNSSNQDATDTTNNAIHLRGDEPKVTISGKESELNILITSQARRGLYLNGANPQLHLTDSHLKMEVVSGQGINLKGKTPQVFLDNGDLVITNTTGSQGMILDGEDALLSLSHQSEANIIGRGQGGTENIQIGNSNARPELSITDRSRLSVTTTSAVGVNLSNIAVHLMGTSPRLNVQDSTLDIDITSGGRDGLFLEGNGSDIVIVDSCITVRTESIVASAIQTSRGTTGATVIKNSELTIPIGNLSFMNGEILEIHNSQIDSSRLFYNALDVVIKNNSYVKLHHDGSRSGTTATQIQGTVAEGVMGGNRSGQSVTIKSGSIVDISRTDGVDRNGFRMGGSNNTVSIEQGGKLFVDNLGNGTPNDSQDRAPNAGVAFRNGDSNKFIVKDPGSEVSIIAQNGAAITNSWGSTKFSMDLEISNGGYFSAVGNTATNNSGTFNVSTLNVNFDNPLFLDFRNIQSDGGVVFSANSSSSLVASNSDLALWQKLSDLDSDPTFNFRNIKYSFSGENLSTLDSTNNPEELNTSVIGTEGLSQFSRISSNNGRWAIADE